MGIHGFLPLLKSIMAPIDVKDLRGCTVAVDTYSWLHKGALGCSKELCTGQPASRHINYCMHRVNLLRHHGIKPILVFDGGLLPMKSEQEAKRSRARKENLERAIEHESAGNSSAAYEYYQKAVDISPSVAFELIQVLRQENVDYIVAPYEADAQMTFLSLNKHVDAVITEDSDLIPFGCSRIIFKMDKYGQGVEFKSTMLHKNKGLNFSGFTKQMLLEMCIFSGCDYLESLPGMGLKKAHALVSKYKSYEKVLKHLRYSGVSIQVAYEETFKKAIWTFLYQRVYDPMTEEIVHLMTVPHDFGCDLEFLGPSMPQHVAKGIAQGELDPFTKQPFHLPSVTIQGEGIPSKNYIPNEPKHIGERKKLDLPAQKNVLTNYFCLASLEAKRKFIAPRVKPCGESESSPETEANFSCLTEENSPCNIGGSQVSISVPKLEEYSLPQKEHAAKPSCVNAHGALQKGCNLKVREIYSLPNEIIGHGRGTKRKVIVRSSYFQHKGSDEEEKNGKNKKFALEEHKKGISSSVYRDLVNDIEPEKENVETGLSINNRFPHQVHTLNKEEVLQVNHTHETESFSLKGGLMSPDDRGSGLSSGTADSNVKFGCNISHLSHYSSISEKSLEKFVSVLSSFKCVASGSRASGLRAPLKDKNSTSSTRSNIEATDLSKYSYRPRNHKASVASKTR